MDYAEKKMRFFLMYDIMENDGSVFAIDEGDIWSSSNPNGWTWQDIGGQANFVGAYESKKDALARLLELKSIHNK